MNKKVLIITLNYDQNQYTLNCLESLLVSDYENFEVLLIDNGSKPENVLELEKALPGDSRIIFKGITPNRGYVGGVNYGLDLAKEMFPDYILILNNDTVIDPVSIKELVYGCERNSDMAITTGKVLDYNEPEKIQQFGSRFTNRRFLKYAPVGANEIDDGQFDREQEMDMIDDVFWLFPFQLYLNIGGYSEYFWFNSEQADFALRAKAVGYKLIFIPAARIWHKGSVSIGGRDFNPALAYWNVQSSLTLRYLHLSSLNFLLFYFITFFGILRTYIKSCLLYMRQINRFRYSYAKLKGFLYFTGWVFKKKKNIGENPFLSPQFNK